MVNSRVGSGEGVAVGAGVAVGDGDRVGVGVPATGAGAQADNRVIPMRITAKKIFFIFLSVDVKRNW